MAAVAFTLLILAFAAVARGLSRLYLTAPIAFVGAGAALSLIVSAPEIDAVLPIRLVAEICLALVLFAEAAHVRPSDIRADGLVIARMLLIGLALSIGLGYLAVRLLLPDLTFLGPLRFAVWLLFGLVAVPAREARSPSSSSSSPSRVSRRRAPGRMRRRSMRPPGTGDHARLAARHGGSGNALAPPTDHEVYPCSSP